MLFLHAKNNKQIGPAFFYVLTKRIIKAIYEFLNITITMLSIQ